jgi:hypothetical protein
MQSSAAPMTASVHPAIRAFGLGPGKLVLQDAEDIQTKKYYAVKGLN